jgi:hypothetical protein
MPKCLSRLIDWVVKALVLAFLLTASTPVVDETYDRVRRFTRGIEFDYATWTANAAWSKIQQAAAATPNYIRAEKQKQIVARYFSVTQRVLLAEAQINLIYTNPEISDPAAAAAWVREELKVSTEEQRRLLPLAETVLQMQVGEALAEMGLAPLGQSVPPVLYHVSPLPLALIVSPRERIQTDANISLRADLNPEQQSRLEDYIDQTLNVSSLVVPVGGIGAYPTMVMETTDLNWQVETIAHEWIHNYLSLRPLGMNYETSPELRTMNETTASIAGKEIGQQVLRRHYPERLIGQETGLQTLRLFDGREGMPTLQAETVFDFRAEMHITRLEVDKLLAEGKVEEAEAYMEQRRRVFWEHGYPIRKLNQAYFAFYGAYADVPGGAAGEDPVGPAVRELRARSASLKEFLERISWMNSFEDLKAALGQ